MAVWRHCEDSATFIFGESTGDQTADTILQALRANPNGLTRQDVNTGVFARNKKADEITRAMRALVQRGLARFVAEADTGGRPRERWFAVGQARGA